MNFELGKKYIVEVTEKGIIPREKFLEEKYFNKDLDDLDFLTDEEKVVVVNEVLNKIRAEIEPKCDRINSLASVLPYTAHREIQELLCEIMDLCKAESEDK